MMMVISVNWSIHKLSTDISLLTRPNIYTDFACQHLKDQHRRYIVDSISSKQADSFPFFFALL